MEEIIQVSTDKNVIELIELLKKNQMEREASNVVDLVSYIDVLQDKLEMMNKQLDDMRKEVSHVRETQDKTIEAKINKAVERIVENLNRLEAYMIEQTQLRVDGLKKSIKAVKNFIVNKSKEIVSDFKTTGKKALFKVSELLRIRHVFDGMKRSVENGIQETNNTLFRIDEFGKEMCETKQELKAVRGKRRNALRALFGKEPKDNSAVKVDNSSENISEIQMSDNKKYFKTELAKKPWRWQRGVYESIKMFLESSIDKLNNLESAVRDTMSKEPDYEIDERIFAKEEMTPNAVVAEQDHKYGADVFEEHMKNQGAKEEIVDLVSLKPPKR